MRNDTRKAMDAFFKGTKSLTRQLTSAEAEAEYTVTLKDFSPVPIPFGALNPQWRELLSMMRPGDEIWEFEETNGRGDSMKGVKLLRNGKVIDTIVARVKSPYMEQLAKRRGQRKKKSKKKNN